MTNGTEKQIAWAEKLKAEALQSVADYNAMAFAKFAQALAAGKTNAADVATATANHECWAGWVAAQEDALQWIEWSKVSRGGQDWLKLARTALG
ncbi:MAG: hypothetical protein H0U60_13215 [Blastocatellia bacterium]|nr:hypothetical protein [Blastocatellia bacterium]